MIEPVWCALATALLTHAGTLNEVASLAHRGRRPSFDEAIRPGSLAPVLVAAFHPDSLTAVSRHCRDGGGR